MSPSALAALLAAGMSAAAVPDEVRAQTSTAGDSLRITGLVVDVVSREPLPGAKVSFLAGEEGAGARAPGGGAASGVLWAGTTDEGGWFASNPLAAGTLTLRVEALGFRPVSRTVGLQRGHILDIRVELVPEPLELEPLVVVSSRRSRLETAGFYERRRLGQGYSITRAEFSSRNPSVPSDIFRMIPGVQIERPRRAMGSPLLRYRGCYPDLVLDGVPLVGPVAPDDILSVHHIEAVEVHSGAFFPARPGVLSCGTVMIWTRDPSTMEGGGPFSLKKLLAVVGFAGLAILLAR
jgi:hypothetical protein